MEDSYKSDNQDESASNSSNTPKYNYEYNDQRQRPGLGLGSNSTHHINIERIHQIKNAMINVCRVVNKYGNAPLPPFDSKYIRENGWVDSNSPWADAPVAMNEIASAGIEMNKALQRDGCQEASSDDDKKEGEWWEPILSKDTKSATRDSEKSSPRQGVQLSAEEQEQFERIHMEWATNAFAEELEALRKGTLEQQFGVKKKKVDSVEDLLDQNELSFVVSKQKKSSNNTNSNNGQSEDIDVQVLADMVRSGGNLFSDVEKRMLLRARQHGDSKQKPGSDVDRQNSLSIHELRRRKLGFI
jgi:hypothetical protein